ncbi:MAG TPA: hypothetical protein VFZ61_06405, partial [Polyangiales bacterium]
MAFPQTKEGTVIGSMHASRSRRFGWPLALALVALCVGFAGLPAGASAQDNNASDWGGGPVNESSSSQQCTPKCRRGFECHRGECQPICSPACGPGFLCTSNGTCVRTDAPEPMPQSSNSGWGAGGQQCLPSCRSGYLCVSGQCVSACNPICPAGEMCTERGECVPATGAAAASASDNQSSEPEKKEEPSPSADSHVNLHADVLGLLQFGLTPTVEFGGKHVAGFARFRPLNTGLLSYFLLDHEDDDVFKWGLGGALGLHIFSAGAGNMRGAFGGLALEYVFGKNENKKVHQAVYKTHALIPQLDAGYRWAFNRLLL